jgi:hypothetical protein
VSVYNNYDAPIQEAIVKHAWDTFQAAVNELEAVTGHLAVVVLYGDASVHPMNAMFAHSVRLEIEG